jgi:hypothetical protein
MWRIGWTGGADVALHAKWRDEAAACDANRQTSVKK